LGLNVIIDVSMKKESKKESGKATIAGVKKRNGETARVPICLERGSEPSRCADRAGQAREDQTVVASASSYRLKRHFGWNRLEIPSLAG
jgi:hypothetical protein